MTIRDTVVEELGSANPMSVTVDESVVNDPFFVEMAFPQFLKAFGELSPIAAASRLGLLCFQAGMLYERARQKRTQDDNVVEWPVK